MNCASRAANPSTVKVFPAHRSEDDLVSDPITFYLHDAMFVISPSKLVSLALVVLVLLVGVALAVWHCRAKD